MDRNHIQFCLDKSKIDLRQLKRLFEVGAFWAKDRKIEEISIAIENSNPVVSVWQQRNLIGFARATSDGVYRAAIWDVVIDPKYRGYGIGTKLVETVLAHPMVNKVEKVYLTTTNQKSFYQSIGFQPNTSNTMVLLNSKGAESVPLLEGKVRQEKTYQVSYSSLDNN